MVDEEEEIEETEETEEEKDEAGTVNDDSGSMLSLVIGAVPTLAFGYFALTSLLASDWIGTGVWTVLAVGGASIALSAIHVNTAWNESIILRLGNYSRKVGSGLFFTVPVIEEVLTRDLRVRTLDIPKQEVITKDNISVGINAVVFLKVKDTKKSILNIQNFLYAIQQYAQTTLRNIVGQKELDELLTKRDEVAKSVKSLVDKQSEEWGIDIVGIELQDIELPMDMKRIIARQAEAEREKRGVIIASEGEVEASKNLKKAAATIASSPKGIAMRLRELATISDVSQDDSNTIVFYPVGIGKDVLAAGAATRTPKPRKTN